MMTKAREILTSATLADIKKASQGEASSTSANHGFNPQVLGDIQSGKDTPGGVLKGIGFKPERNPMGDLFQPSYHFSFYLDSDVPEEQGQGREFVIAETGLTAMNIQSIDIDGFVGPNIRTRNATATNITMKIFEPYGSQFPDLLYQAAVRMNIRNYLKAPWFLRLKLHGYDENGIQQVVGGGWKWKMVLIDVQSQISESGSTHTVTAMPQAEVALNNQYCMLPTVVNTSGSTVGEVLKNIASSMNENVKTTYGPTNPPVLEYVIEDRPYPYDTKVGINRPFDHRIVADAPQDSNARTAVKFGTQTTQFAPGTDIPAVVDMLMSRTDTAVQAARISREKPATSGPDLETTVRDAASLMHRIDTKVEYLAYNAVIGDYCKRITFVIKPFQTLRLLTSMGRAMSFDREKTLNAQKARHAVTQVLMKKQYDYIFTGLNTEVEKFDINVNFRWAVSVPVVQGWNTQTGTTARVDNAATVQQHQLQLQQSASLLSTKTTELADYDKELAEITSGGGTITAEQTARRQELDAALQAAKLQNQQQGTIFARESDAINAAADDAAAKRRLAAPVMRRITDGEDDIYSNGQDGSGGAKAGYGGAGTGDTSFLPITIVQDPEAPIASVATSTSTDNNANKGIYGALLNQLYGSFDGNLQSIELDIRGDPYWLGPGAAGDIYDVPSSGTTPNFMNGEHLFVFRFKLPQGYDQTTGTVSLPEDDDGKSTSGGNSNIFTGFYATTQITHHFREGYFSQTLQGVRVQGWSYENIIEGREVTAEGTTIYSDTKAPTPLTPPAGTAGAGATVGPNTTGNRGSGARSSDAPRGIRNNNPGNLRASAFAQRRPGYVGADSSGFAIFSSADAGIKAQETLLLHNYVQTPTTVDAVIERYLGKNVPGNINSQVAKANYKKYVTSQLGKSNIGPGDATALAAAMRNFENGTR
jgi:hypothetical protein